jgi:hypothetical protein
MLECLGSDAHDVLPLPADGLGISKPGTALTGKVISPVTEGVSKYPVASGTRDNPSKKFSES